MLWGGLLALPGGLIAQNGPLRVSPDGTHLQYRADGCPFFYLADTAWELLHRCDRQELRHYLTTRKRQGFNVVQCVILAELDGLTVPNAAGALPLRDFDPTRPEEAYFRHVDFAVGLADSLGMYLALLPTWGDKFNRKWGVGPEIFTPENAAVYGRFLAERYRDAPVIWLLGGDRNPENAEDLAIVRSMAAAMRAVTGQRQLYTYHPQGGSSSVDFFAEDDWLDFHMFQSGHGGRDSYANFDLVRDALRTDTTRPVINGEPQYEDHPINWRPANGWFDDADTRQAAYWSVLAGAKGHTFGNHNIWQMWLPGREPISRARTPWLTALHYPGAAQMGHLRKLLEVVDFAGLVRNDGLLVDAPNSGGRVVIATRHADTGALLAYTPYGDALTLRVADLPPNTSARWYDPRTGNYVPTHEVPTGSTVTYDPPYDPARGNDWVLVVE